MGGRQRKEFLSFFCVCVFFFLLSPLVSRGGEPGNDIYTAASCRPSGSLTARHSDTIWTPARVFCLGLTDPTLLSARIQTSRDAPDFFLPNSSDIIPENKECGAIDQHSWKQKQENNEEERERGR